ncbi:hypothetical protein HY495_03595 [Candidatus Woesearchaeota archaeon]|nr:hypothetical protein [Candidatus Woesearchaeota archaeon]
MEQKQLDEMDESFFAEEYMEEDVLSEDFLDELDAKEKTMNPKKENPFASALDSPQEEKSRRVPPRKIRESKILKTATAKAEPKVSVKSEVKKPQDEVVITPVKAIAPVRVVPLKEERKHLEKSVSEQKEKAETKTETKSEKTAKYVEPTPRVDPWADDKKESKKEVKTEVKNNPELKKEPKASGEGGLFKDVSTWKALTGLTIILLLFSVFTQGFQFTEKTASLGQELSLAEAEARVTSYVNENLLRPPFVAEVVATKEVAGLYQITISVAGQAVDSYLTKDGKIFFPQGLDTSVQLGLVVDSPDQNAPTSVSPPVQENSPTESPPEPSVVASPPAETGASQTMEVTLVAKRWLFDPPLVTVQKGSTVVFNLVPENLDFTFAVPGLGVAQKVSGPTKVTVVTDKVGSFEYACSSCDEWRGMKGTLVVE